MLFMVIEKFRENDGPAVYRRFREKGRMLPDGLKYLDSWVEVNGNRCFQLMECGDVQLFQQWIARWNDLVDFEIVAVRTSQEAAAGHEMGQIEGCSQGTLRRKQSSVKGF